MYYRYRLIDTSFLEDQQSQQHTIPEDIKKHIADQPQYASISASVRVPILMYHYVEYVQDKNDRIRQSLDIPPIIFEQQIKVLQENGYTFMTNKELADVLDGKTQLPTHPILLTFDDGYRDFYTDVLPILLKYHVKATNYLISGFLNHPNHLLSNQVQEMIKSGLVEIGAHTVDHMNLKGRSLADVTSEVAQSKTTLEQQFNTRVVSFAYPFGGFDQQALNIVKSVGFRTAVSTIPGILQNQGNRFFLYRIRPGYRTGQTLLLYLEQNTFQAY